MSENSSELLETVRKIHGLLELLAEDKIAQRDAKQRTALREIVGSSISKQKSVYLMDGTQTQAEIRRVTSVNGSDDPSNLIALCSYCHDMYHRGTISAESIYIYKARLLFLNECKKDFLVVSGDGLLHFGRLIAAGLATVEQKKNNNWQIVTYAVNISDKGRQIIEAWKQGDRTRLRRVMGGPVPGGTEGKP